MLTVVTTFSPAGYAKYGQNFIETFDKHWSKDTKLVVYHEGAPLDCPRAELRDIRLIHRRQRFIQRYGASAQANGRVPNELWKPAEKKDGYSFRHDAVKFCNKVFAVADAAVQLNASGQVEKNSILLWLDADTRTFKDVPWDWVSNLLGGYDYAYLGRTNNHSECGFLAFRLPNALPLILDWETQYDTSMVFKLPETHDSYVFDYCRNQLKQVKGRDLSPGGRAHVWLQSPLAVYMDHMKGKRKSLGYSPELVAMEKKNEPHDKIR